MDILDSENENKDGDNGDQKQNLDNEYSPGILTDGILKSGSVVTKNSRESVYCLTIIGQIEGHYALGDSQKATKY